MRRVQKGTARLPWSPIITKKIDLFGWIWIWGNLIGASQTSDECHQDMFQCCGVRCDAKLEHVKDYCAYWVILQRNTQLYKISKPQAPYYPKLWSIAILISSGILYIMYELLQTLSTWKNQEQWNHFHVLQIIASAEGSLYFNKTLVKFIIGTPSFRWNIQCAFSSSIHFIQLRVVRRHVATLLH